MTPTSRASSRTRPTASSLILSILPDITWGEKTIISLENNWIVDEYRRVFRSCGRFGWSLAYTLFIFCFFVFSKINLHKKTNFLIFVLLGSFILQIYDLKNWLIIKRNFAQLENGYKMDFSNKYKNLKKNSYFKHVYVDVSTKYNPEEFYKVAYWAHNNNLTLNNFYLARILKVEYCTPDYTSLDTIFIFNSNNLEDINRFKYSYETEIGTFTANVPIDWDI